jgi:4-hydroxybenzoate polyprenyltransferase
MYLQRVYFQLNNIKDFIEKHKYAALMRLDKPTGIYLTLLPALWTIAFASKNLLELIYYFIIFTVGAVSTRSAGCIINDIIDREFDVLVERTKNRPLASGKISLKEAQIALGCTLSVSFLILLTLPKVAVILGIIACLLIFLYPLMKRVTYYPQLFLGIVFNSGVLIAWYSVNSGFSYPPILIYIATILWTLGYDTVYGHQDIVYDKEIGVKSLSIKLGAKTPDFVWNVYIMMSVLLSIVGFLCYMNIVYFMVLAFAFYLFYWQSSTLKIDNPEDCAEKFRSNAKIGLVILIGILIGRI